MHKECKILLKEAKQNKEFNVECKKQMREQFSKPGIFASFIMEHLYAAMYLGYLIGKGEYNQDKYINKK